MKKKGWVLLLTGCLICFLTACGDDFWTFPGCGSTGSSENQKYDNTAEISDCGEEYSGYVGDTISTAFFDFSVDSVQICDSYKDYKPTEGMQLVIADLTIKNTETYSLPMGNSDFQIQWGEGRKDYDWAVAGSLCTDYKIPINETAKGDLVFEVPKDAKDCSIFYQEYYADSSMGDSFFVYFTVKKP